MIGKSKLIAVIPAKKNSSRLKKKNLQKLGKYSLVEKAILYAKSLNEVDKVIVSTDCKKIYKVAKKYEFNEKKLRDKKLSRKYSLTSEVIIKIIKENHFENDYILLLQPTTPFRNKKDFKNLLKKFKSNKDKAIVSVIKNNFIHPYKTLKLKNKYLKPFFGRETNFPRQKLGDVYASNGAFYLIKGSTLIKYKTFIPPKTAFYEMPQLRSINIDYPEDLKIAKSII